MALAGLVVASAALDEGTTHSEALVTTGLAQPLPGSAGVPIKRAPASTGTRSPSTPSPVPPWRRTEAPGTGPAIAGQTANRRQASAATTAPPAAVPATVSGPAVQTVARGGCKLRLSTGKAAPVGHCTVLEIGDSLGNDLGWGLDRQLAATSGLHLVQLDVSSTGLALASYYNWPQHLQADLARYRPQLVLISLGGNDQQGMMVSGTAVQFPSQPWEAAYAARVLRLMNEASASGAYVLWVGMPVMQQARYSEGMQVLDRIYARAASRTADTTYLSTWDLFSEPGVGFTMNAMVNGKLAALRQDDGIHYSFVGEDVLASYVIAKMAAVYHVTLAAQAPAVITGWVRG